MWSIVKELRGLIILLTVYSDHLQGVSIGSPPTGTLDDGTVPGPEDVHLHKLRY